MKYVSLLVGDLNQRNIGIITKAKAVALREWREDIESGRKDRVSSCLGGEVSAASGDANSETLTTNKLRNMLGTKKTAIFHAPGSYQDSASDSDTSERAGHHRSAVTEAVEDDFFADDAEGNENNSSKPVPKASAQGARVTKRNLNKEEPRQMNLKSKLAPGTKQGDRLRKWQRLHSSKSSFISVARSGKRNSDVLPESTGMRFKKQRSDVSNNHVTLKTKAKSPRVSPSTAARQDAGSWQAGGGVSAAVNTARNRQKQLGLIVEGTGKKVVFD